MQSEKEAMEAVIATLQRRVRDRDAQLTDLRANALGWYTQNLDLIVQRDQVWRENQNWREQMRRAIDLTWGRALEDGSVPSSKIVDELIASARGLVLPPAAACNEQSEVTK